MLLCPQNGRSVGKEKCDRVCWGRTELHATGCLYLQTGKRELNEYDLAHALNMPVNEIKESVARGKEKLTVWLRLITLCEESLHVKGHEVELSESERNLLERANRALDQNIPASVFSSILKKLPDASILNLVKGKDNG